MKTSTNQLVTDYYNSVYPVSKVDIVYPSTTTTGDSGTITISPGVNTTAGNPWASTWNSPGYTYTDPYNDKFDKFDKLEKSLGKLEDLVLLVCIQVLKTSDDSNLEKMLAEMIQNRMESDKEKESK